MDDIPIGPNPCDLCGGEYGEHAEDCKTRKVHPEEVSMFDLLMENRNLRIDVARLERTIKELRAGQ